MSQYGQVAIVVEEPQSTGETYLIVDQILAVRVAPLWNTSCEILFKGGERLMVDVSHHSVLGALEIIRRQREEATR